MRVMVLGATGFIGPALMRQIQILGHEPIGVSRRAPPEADGLLYVVADRNDPKAIAALAGAHRVDVVVDLLALTLEPTSKLIAHLDGAVGGYVLASSGDVYRQYAALQRKEDAGPPLESLSEAAPLRTIRFPYRSGSPRAPDDPQAWMDDYDKIPIEAAVLSRPSLPAVVLRLPMVYGPRDRQRRFGWAIEPMRAGRPRLDLDSEWAAWRTSYGYVEDVAHGLALAAVHPRAAGGAYNLGPLESPDHEGWAQRIAEVLGWRGEIRRVPRAKAPAARRAALNALDFAYPMVTDTSRIRRELDYSEVVSAEQALRDTIAATP
jgi:nucleoside-diphosphate-sugar epimerase